LLWNTGDQEYGDALADLVRQLGDVVKKRSLNRQDALRLRGRLGFADAFLHGRLGALVLKRLVDHAYGSTAAVDDDLAGILEMMILRLQTAGPKTVNSQAVREWFVFTDAAYDKESQDGGLGAVLVSNGDCTAWFSVQLDKSMCDVFGASDKETINYL
jgi:hypothetical protein